MHIFVSVLCTDLVFSCMGASSVTCDHACKQLRGNRGVLPSDQVIKSVSQYNILTYSKLVGLGKLTIVLEIAYRFQLLQRLSSWRNDLNVCRKTWALQGMIPNHIVFMHSRKSNFCLLFIQLSIYFYRRFDRDVVLRPQAMIFHSGQHLHFQSSCLTVR